MKNLISLLLFSAIVSSYIFLTTPTSEYKKRQYALSENKKADGWYLEYIDDDIAKVMHPVYGYLKHVKLTAPEIKLGKNANENIQVIDLREVDTSVYSKMFEKKGFFEVGGGLGYPIQIADFDNNGKLDFAGGYKRIQDTKIGQAGIVELELDGSFVLKKVYSDSAVTPLKKSNLDQDDFFEFNFDRKRDLANYECDTPGVLPDTSKFKYERWQFGGSLSSEEFGDFDNDGNIEMLYVGDDTLAPNGNKIFIAEFNNSINNLIKEYRYSPSEWHVATFAIGDFDMDGFTEFTTGSIDGDVYVFETLGPDSFNMIFHDTLSTSNAYLSIKTNDIDSNSKIEFFVGGSSYFNGIGGTRFYWFEANGNNSYKKIRSFLLLGVDPFSWDEIHAFDANNDGKDDILINYTYAVVILVWNNDTQEFEIFYFSYWDYPIHGVTMHPVSNKESLDLFISTKENDNIPVKRTYYFENKIVTSIKNTAAPVSLNYRLNQNYPNPFNITTKFSFSLSKREHITIKIFNNIGKEVITLRKNKTYFPGKHTVTWNGTNNNGKEVSSGIYYYVLSDGKQKLSRKMLLIK